MHDRFSYIDALRGFAILGVLITHAGSLVAYDGPLSGVVLNAGVGVQLFFVISAFTIFLTFGRSAATETAPVRNFFIKRLLRIVPVYWLGIVVYTTVYGLGSRGWAGGVNPEIWHYPFHITLTNLLLPQTMSSVVPGGWSISCEVIFYLTVPIWFVWVRSLRGAVIFAVAAIFAGPLFIELIKPLVSPIFGATDPTWLRLYWFRAFPNQLGCFALGVVLFFLLKADHPFVAKLKDWRWNLALILASLIPMALGLIGLFPIMYQHLFSLGFLMLAAALSQIPWGALVNPVTTFFGRISYSSYLVHFFVLKQITLLLPQNDMPLMAYFAMVVTLGVAGTVPLAYLGYRFVETPTSRLGKAWIERLERGRNRGRIDQELKTAP